MGKKSKSSIVPRSFGAGVLTVLIVSLSFFIGANRANASISSFISGLFFESANSEGHEITRINSQNVELLDASYSQKLSQGNGDIAIVDETALESQGDSSGENIVFPQGDQISVYVVRKGDTLSQIAKMYGVSSNTILWANDIKNGVISEGETLTILPISGVKHIVKKGETIQGIVKQHGGDLKEVLQFNDISIETKLGVGDEIIVPDGEVKTAVVKSTPSPSPSTFPTTKPKVNSKFSNLPDYGDYYMRPLDIGVGHKSQGIHGYNGVDLAGPVGSSVMASAEGTVLVSKNSGWNGGYGDYVVIQHSNGTQTLYAHLNKSIVSVGMRVSKGQVIGYLGSTGNSTGPHVHFEIRGAKNNF